MDKKDEAWFIVEGLLRVVKNIKSSIGVTKEVENLIKRSEEFLDTSK